MSFLEEAYSPYEMVSLQYNHTDRFLMYAFSRNRKKLEMQFEADLALDTELQQMKKGIAKIPDFPKQEREFEDCSFEFQCSMFLCMRITNLSKILFVLKKYNRKEMQTMITKLTYMKCMLQDEFKDLYGIEYNEMLDNKEKYKAVFDYDLSYVEYLIHNDLYSYFDNKSIDDYDFYTKNRKTLYQYMTIIYLDIELEFIKINFEDEADTKKTLSSFSEYYEFTRKANRELQILQNDVDKYRQSIDINSVISKKLTHELYIIQNLEEENELKEKGEEDQ